YILVGQEGHRSNRTRTMTLLARPLKDWCDVLCKRCRGRSGGLRRGERRTSHEATERQCQTTYPPSMLSRHANLQEQCSRSPRATIARMPLKTGISRQIASVALVAH